MRIKITNAWVVDPLVTNLDITQPPQLYLHVEDKLPRLDDLDMGSFFEGGFHWLYTKIGPLRGYWIKLEPPAGPGSEGSWWPLGARVNELEQATRPVVRVQVTDPEKTRGWFLDLDHAIRLVKKFCKNTHMSVWSPWAKEGTMEWAPQDIAPTCKWNVGDMTVGDNAPCGRVAYYPMGGRVLAVCSEHKANHDKFFALERGREKGASRNG